MSDKPLARSERERWHKSTMSQMKKCQEWIQILQPLKGTVREYWEQLWGFPFGSVVKNVPAMQETWIQSLGQEDPQEKEMATHSSILERIPMDRGARWATVHRVTQNWTWLMYGCESWTVKKAEELMLLNCGVGEDSWESPGLQGDPFWRRSALGFLWKEWCRSWNSSTLATSCKELTHWKRFWCWEGLGAEGERDHQGWDGWMVSLTRWTWVWVNSGRWWWTGRPGVQRFMGSQRVGHAWATELNWTEATEHTHSTWTTLCLYMQQFKRNRPICWLLTEIRHLTKYFTPSW